jgi:NAD+ kinase
MSQQRLQFDNDAEFDSVFYVKKVNGQETTAINEIIGIIRSQLYYINKPSKIVREITDINEIDSHTLIIAIGGDGTMVYAARLSSRTGATVMGVSLSKVGFLTDFTVDDLHGKQQIRSIFSKHETSTYPREQRVMLSVTDATSRFYATNEISIANNNSDSVIDYTITVDGLGAGTHRANSVIVATPTGSTAYALSAGGAIIYPSLNVLEITPVAPITMSSRSIIVGGYSTIEISARVRDGGQISIRGDGRLISTYNTANSEDAKAFTIKTDFNPATLLHTPNWNFFDVLTDKLGWN